MISRRCTPTCPWISLAAARLAWLAYLAEHGYQVLEVGNGAEMRAAVALRVPRVVLLDVGLPGEDGLSLARYLRERFDVGIIMISGAGETVDRIVGLEVGADDYISKPFDPRELRARLKSVLRRYQHPSRAASTASAGQPSLQPGAWPSAAVFWIWTHASYSMLTDRKSPSLAWSSNCSRCFGPAPQPPAVPRSDPQPHP